jgi:transcriptional regulator with XRE-family HTH domain
MSPGLEVLPERIKRLRESKGLPQFELARMCGLTQAQISAYEIGRSFPGLESTIKLAHAFGTTVAELIGESEPKTAPPRPPSKHEMALWVIESLGIDGFRLETIRRLLLEKY